MAVDSVGNLWIADTSNNAIRVVSSDGRLTTYFGGPTMGGWADGPIASAKVWSNAPNSGSRTAYPSTRLVI
jgi:sugar lactone lactonase YvrE